MTRPARAAAATRLSIHGGEIHGGGPHLAPSDGALPRTARLTADEMDVDDVETSASSMTKHGIDGIPSTGREGELADGHGGSMGEDAAGGVVGPSLRGQRPKRGGFVRLSEEG